MTSTDLKPGDIVQHPEHGFGFIVLLKKDLGDVPASEAVVRSTNPRRNYGHAWDLDGWERVETVRPGHVQVRVNDLDLSHWLNKQEDDDIWGEASRVAIRAAKAIAAKRAESTPTADEKPTSTTVTLYCPKCGEEIVNQVVVRLDSDTLNGGYYLAFDGEYPVTNHRCQPDEPQGFGARVTVTLPDGVREKWLRQPSRWWVSEWGGESMWRYLIERGTVTLGWESE